MAVWYTQLRRVGLCSPRMHRNVSDRWICPFKTVGIPQSLCRYKIMEEESGRRRHLPSFNPHLPLVAPQAAYCIVRFTTSQFTGTLLSQHVNSWSSDPTRPSWHADVPHPNPLPFPLVLPSCSPSGSGKRAVTSTSVLHLESLSSPARPKTHRAEKRDGRRESGEPKSVAEWREKKVVVS